MCPGAWWICSCCFFFSKQKTAYELRISDWSSDVCSSDLFGLLHHAGLDRAEELFAVLAPLPHLAGEAPLARRDLAHVAIERGVVLRAVEHVRDRKSTRLNSSH